jgi:hypothetical protein
MRVRVAELHLQKNEHLGQTVIVSGRAVALGEGATYFVLEDNKEKLIVVLVRVHTNIRDLKEDQEYEVLGQVVTQGEGVLALEASEVKPL